MFYLSTMDKIENLSVAITHVEANEERPLSPVLTSNKSHRQIAYNRKRTNKQKSRINLVSKFQSKSESSTLDSQELLPNASFIGALCAAERIKRLEKIENERKKFYNVLAAPVLSERVSKGAVPSLVMKDEFHFKKPISPMTGFKIKKSKGNNTLESSNDELWKLKANSECNIKVNSIKTDDISDSQMLLAANLAETGSETIEYIDDCNQLGISDSQLSRAADDALLSIEKEHPLTEKTCKENDQYILSTQETDLYFSEFSSPPASQKESTVINENSKSLVNVPISDHDNCSDFIGFTNSEYVHSLKHARALKRNIELIENKIKDVSSQKVENLTDCPNCTTDNVKRIGLNVLEDSRMINQRCEQCVLFEDEEECASSENIKTLNKSKRKRYHDEVNNQIVENEQYQGNNKNSSGVVRMRCKKIKYEEDNRGDSPTRRIQNENRIEIELNKGVSINITCSTDKKVSIINRTLKKFPKSDNSTYESGTSIEQEKCKSKVLNKQLRRTSKSKITSTSSNQIETVGFRCASGKEIHVSEKSLSKAHTMYKEVETTNIDSVINIQKNKSTALVSPGKKSGLTKTSAEKPLCVGFTTGSGKSISVSEKALTKAKRIYKETEEKEKLKTELQVASRSSPEKDKKTLGSPSGSGKIAQMSGRALDKARSMISDMKDCLDHFISDNGKKSLTPTSSESGKTSSFASAHKMNRSPSKLPATLKDNTKSSEENRKDYLPQSVGFTTGSGKAIKVSDKAMHRADAIYKEIEKYDCSTYISDVKGYKNVDNLKLHSVESAIPDDILDKAMDFYEQIKDYHNLSDNVKNRDVLTEAVKFFDNVNEAQMVGTGAGFKTASGKSITISEDSIKKAQEIYNKVSESANENDDQSFSKTVSLQSSSNHTHSHSQSSVYKCKSESSIINDSPQKLETNLRNKNSISNVTTPGSKKRLGISGCKQIVIPERKLEAAKLLLQEENLENRTFKVKYNVASPKYSSNVYSSTPIRNSKLETIDETSSHDLKINSLTKSILTPVKDVKKSPGDVKSEAVGDSHIIIRPLSPKNIKEIQTEMDKEYKKLKRKMEAICAKWRALDLQLKALESKENQDKRPSPGWLFQRKRCNKDRLQLKDLEFNFQPADLTVQSVRQITPKNAVNVHFNFNSADAASTNIINTIDGATIIPSIDDAVGVNEIENGFSSMPGVDPALIPKGWIFNHYKWIVWKLASYDLKCGDNYKVCLNIENVMAQLKYRYDREIDRAERPALRKILEKDDIPQKRMVLCVSDVFEDNGKYELELTDGWYAIRTLVDSPLSFQIHKTRIRIGYKLLVQCADLLNCEGCHPLEVPDFVRLKISYNNTRRANWDSKLGYQRVSIPFPIALKSVNPDGGIISCLKLFIARVYPLQYLEEQGHVKVWRNKKAEDRRNQEFETEQYKNIEKIQESMQKDYERTLSVNRKFPSNVSVIDVSNMTCPKTLFEILENSNDPDALMETLSSFQRSKVLEYKQNVYIQKQQELSLKVATEINKLNVSKRKVTSVMKLLALDDNSKENTPTVFSIWKPTEDHLQILKEGSTFLVYNVSVRKGGDLSSTTKTYFKSVNKVSPKVQSCKRQVLPIAIVLESYTKPLFNEFDTVGLVVKVIINSYDQELWIADFVGRLLFVKIWISPQRCSLLDGLNRGSVIALSNLLYRRPRDDFGEAIANSYSVISQYPQQKHLQEGVEKFKGQLPKDTTRLLRNCDNSIVNFLIKIDLKKTLKRDNNSLSFVESPAKNYSEAEIKDFHNSSDSTDRAMSLIDTQTFV